MKPMWGMKNRGIRAKFALTFALVMFLAVMLATGVSILLNRNEIQDQLVSDTRALAALMHKLAETQLSLDEIIDLSQTSFFYEVEKTAIDVRALSPLQQEQLVAGEVALSGSYKGRGLRSYVQIRDQLLVIKVQPHNVFVSNEVMTRILTLAFSLIMATIVFIPFSRRLLKPLLNLNEAMKLVTRGEFDVRVECHSDDEIAELSQNFNLMTQELQSTEMLRNDFIRSVSHEFKTPLTAISGFAELLSGPDVSDVQRVEYAKIIASESQRLSTLTSNILRLSKLETSHFAIKTSRFALDEQLRQVLLTLEPMWSEKNLGLNLELPSVRLENDEELFALVWVNLIGNAIKFSPVGGELSIELTQAGNEISVAISDQGIGMSEDVQNRIFEKFYQADDQRHESGNGLGLALVKEILNHCGGSVEVESIPGRGSTFRVTIANEK